MITKVKKSHRRLSSRRAGRLIMESLEQRTLFSLLGVASPLGLPSTFVLGPDGAMTYSAETHALDVTGVPTLMILPTTPASVVSVGTPSSFDLHIMVDNAGNVSSGTGANDFVLTGSVDVNGDNVPDYTGVLLTGKVEQMGSQADGPDSDFDFRLTVTGGSMAAQYFAGQDIGLLLQTENSTFNGTFTQDFSALPKGVLGPIPPLVGSLPISISGFKFQDQTGNGLTADDMSNPMSNVTIQLYTDVNGKTGTLVASQATDANGYYDFTGLAAGNYIVEEVDPTGYVETGPVSGQYVVNATSGAYANLDFDDYKCNCGCMCGCGSSSKTLTTATSSLAGTVFVDCNNNGVQDRNEQGISGVKITLTGTNLLGQTVSETTTTDRNGNYSFSGLIAGNYTLAETQPSNYADGIDHVGTLGGTLSNDVISNITVPPCAAGVCYTFGELNTTSICGNTGHGGCKVTITGCDDKGNQVCYTTTTDCFGNYDFGDIRGGCYAISECNSKGQSTGYGKSCAVTWSNSGCGYSFCGFSTCLPSWNNLFGNNCWF